MIQISALKLKTIFINVLCPYKRQILMLCFGVRLHENVEHSQRRENVNIYIYRDRSRLVELLLQLEYKQQCGDSTQAHVFVYILEVCIL